MLRDGEAKKAIGVLLLLAFAGGGCLPALNTPDRSLLSILGFSEKNSTGSSAHPTRYLVVSSASHTGDFLNDLALAGSTWAEKADSFCNSNIPSPVAGTGVYRAVLNGSTARTGTSGSQLNWPLRAGVAYFDQDGTTEIAIANAGNLFDIPVTNNFPLGGNYWTGAGDATTWAVGNTCTDWSATGSTGEFGIGTYPNSSLFLQGTGNCSFTKTILCAQDLKDTGNGTVSSALQNLTWMKCNFGETWDSGSNTCTGSPVNHQFCTAQDNHCNGGTNSGALTGIDSQIYDDCASLNLAGRSWRVPTPAELANLDEYQAGSTAFGSLFPTLALGTYYWSNAGYFGDPTLANAYNFSTHWGAVAYKDSTTSLLCVSDGL